MAPLCLACPVPVKAAIQLLISGGLTHTQDLPYVPPVLKSTVNVVRNISPILQLCIRIQNFKKYKMYVPVSAVSSWPFSLHSRLKTSILSTFYEIWPSGKWIYTVLVCQQLETEANSWIWFYNLTDLQFSSWVIIMSSKLVVNVKTIRYISLVLS